MPEVTYFSVMILLVFGSVTDTLFYKAFFSVSTLSQLLSGTVLPLCTIVVGNLIVLLPRCAQVHRMISIQIFIHETLFALV